ncbi:hypothetical protein EG329_009386 [Mollisiaceae sp. DMI_Dod_QoI]|nr:hypothetical protein EG329_009386 [Helotiales sp. DMI_Dod_QoI]
MLPFPPPTGKTPASKDTFHPFTRLPTEIQDHIWELTIRGRLFRVVKEEGRMKYTCNDCLGFTWPWFTCPCNVPTAAPEACRASKSLLSPQYVTSTLFKSPSEDMLLISSPWYQQSQEGCEIEFTFNPQYDIFRIGNIDSYDTSPKALKADFYEKVQYAYMTIGALRVQTGRFNPVYTPWLKDFKALKHLFFILTGLPDLARGGVVKEVEEALQYATENHKGWVIPPWSIVEDEGSLLELWDRRVRKEDYVPGDHGKVSKGTMKEVAEAKSEEEFILRFSEMSFGSGHGHSKEG